MKNKKNTGSFYTPKIIADFLVEYLSKKLENIQAKIDQGKFKAALGQLKAFIKMVQAQMGKHITVDAANTLIASAQAVIDTL